MPPLLDEEEKMDADSHFAFIEATFAVYGSSLSAIQVLIADNAPTNISIAKKIGVPFIGCASHRFNLAVEQYLVNFKPLLDKVRFVMKKYRELKNAAALRKKTPLRPILDNETHWSRQKEMLQRFDEFQEFFDTNDPDIVMIYPSVGELYQLKNLLDTLKTLDSITIKLQCEDIGLGDVRLLFDEVIKKFP